MTNLKQNEKLVKIIEAYKIFLINTKNQKEFGKWNAIDHFQKYWNIEASDFSEMFLKSFRKQGNLLYQNSWGFISKAVKHFPEETRNMFRLLYNESEGLRERINQFADASENLLPHVKEATGKDNLNAQQDERTISVYLSLNNPEKYYIYMSGFYKKYCELIDEPVAPPGEKYFHYLKLAENFKNEFLAENSEILALHKKIAPAIKWGDQNLIVQNILFNYNAGVLTDEVKPSEDSNGSKDNNMSNNKLNQILYGPPGTGKTYNTINIALNIIYPEFYQKNKNDRAKLVERYNKLLIKDWENMDTGHIAFTTFHQSMSYEDFVEGIKPFVPDDESAIEQDEIQNNNDNSLEYHIQDGIFKKMCLAAKRPDPSQFDFDAAWEEFWNFIHKSDKDVVFTSTNSKLRHIKNPENKESVKLRYLNSSENPETESKYGFYVSKEWIEKIFRKRLNIHDPNVKKWVEVRDIVGHTGATPAYAFYRKFFEYHDLGKVFSLSKLPGKFVLIIDEINRGNVSQILGELITLIEEDKREGGDEVLEVVLPYSKKTFTVPENLYIIGTMNTADRSVEALDTALRRRFSFIGMPPDPHLIVTTGALKETGGKIGDIDVVKLLETINKRLEKLIDKDHRIGHSYFMHIQNEEELKLTFKDKVIPLLEEYFFGDFGKIGLVLGNSFVEKQQNDAIFASFDAYGDGIEDLAERPVYKIRDQKEWDFVSVYQQKKTYVEINPGI